MKKKLSNFLSAFYEFTKSYLKNFLAFMAIYILIAVIWYAYELLTLGYIATNMFDTIIALILTFSILLNFQFYGAIKKLRNHKVRVVFYNRGDIDEDQEPRSI